MTSHTASASSDALVVFFEDHVQAGISVLLRAYSYARHAGADLWDIAIPISELYEAGLARSDFHWLLASGYAEHARETTKQGADRRSFEREGRAVFHDDTCFVFTPRGADFAARLLRLPPILDEAATESTTRQSAPAVRNVPHEPTALPPHRMRPAWDAQRRTLRVGDLLVKSFRASAANQETVLSVFQEEGWPECIADPLSPSPQITPKRRLHDTIVGLNRNQVNQLIRFFGNGTGEGACWELILDASD